MINEVRNIISDLPSISLDDLSAVDFDSRIDTKFVFHINQLPLFLKAVHDHLKVLEVGGNRVFHYRNLYCDNENFELFHKHHSGFGNRSKVRVRQYSESGPFFFEVKNKTNQGKTLKHRVPISSFKAFENQETEETLDAATGYSFESLSNHTYIEYERMTFSNKELTEKLTIDFQMNTQNELGNHQFENLVITEVKQIKYSSRSPFITALKDLKIYKTSFSKYCASVALLNNTVKKNRFLPIIKNINKIARA